eukprot:743060-Pleurochrysis_carterae.AAC.1
MDALEAPRLASLEAQYVGFARWMRTRRAMPHDAYGTQARLHDGLMYTDDSVKMAVGPEGALNLLVTFHRIVGPAWRGAPDDSGVAAAAAAARLHAEAATLAPPACPPRDLTCG